MGWALTGSRTGVHVKRSSSGIEEQRFGRHLVRRGVLLKLTRLLVHNLHRPPPLGRCRVRRHRNPVRPPRRSRRPGLSNRAPNQGGSFVGALFAEPAEARLLLRVDQVDCPHRELGKAVRATNRAAKRARVADVHSSVTYLFAMLVDVFFTDPAPTEKSMSTD